MKNEELVEEAKRRYPVGTKFYPAHIESKNRYSIVVSDMLSFEDTDHRIVALTRDLKTWDKLSREDHGEKGHQLERNVYYRGKWAEIIPEPVEKKTSSAPLFDNSEEDDSKLSQDALLAKARRNYPIGTICVCLTNKNEEEIVSDLVWFDGNRIVQQGGLETRVYKNDGGNPIWAKIISKPDTESTSKKEESKPNLIVGKWYKHDGWSSPKDFIKCRDANLEDSAIERLIRGSEHITNGKYTNGHTSWSTNINGKSIEYLKEATLEEIQEFLPDGHADKISNDEPEIVLKVGKWYAHKDWKNDGRDFVKCSKSSFVLANSYKYISGSESIANGRFRNKPINWLVESNVKQLKDLREVSLEEIQSYLPDGHPDKLNLSEPLTIEVGKWYFNQKDSYAHCSAIKDSNCLVYDEVVTYGEYHKDTGIWFTHDTMREVTFDEIKKYLPPDHPLKLKPTSSPINKGFVIGKWYKGSDKGPYMKFVRLDNVGHNRLFFTESITGKHFSKVHDYWANKTMEAYALANPVDLQEIQEYLPDGHEDKFPKAMKTENLEGRYILCLNDQAKTHYPCHKGDYLKFVCSLSPSTSVYTYEYWGAYDSLGKQNGNKNDPRYHGINVHSNSDFKLMPIGFVPPSEQEEKNIEGRYVQALIDRPFGGAVKKGEFGILISSRKANFPNHDGYLLDPIWQTTCKHLVQLMPVGFVPPDASKRPKPKYSVGDLVEVVPGGWQYSEVHIDSPTALSHCPSGRQTGKKDYITDIKYSYQHKTYFYKLGSYSNMFTEKALIQHHQAYMERPVFDNDAISERIEHIKNASMPELKSNSKSNILDSSVEDTNIQLAPLRSKSKRIIF